MDRQLDKCCIIDYIILYFILFYDILLHCTCTCIMYRIALWFASNMFYIKWRILYPHIWIFGRHNKMNEWMNETDFAFYVILRHFCRRLYTLMAYPLGWYWTIFIWLCFPHSVTGSKQNGCFGCQDVKDWGCIEEEGGASKHFHFTNTRSPRTKDGSTHRETGISHQRLEV
jgi:hypothetical protein